MTKILHCRSLGTVFGLHHSRRVLRVCSTAAIKRFTKTETGSLENARRTTWRVAKVHYCRERMRFRSSLAANDLQAIRLSWQIEEAASKVCEQAAHRAAIGRRRGWPVVFLFGAIWTSIQERTNTVLTRVSSVVGCGRRTYAIVANACQLVQGLAKTCHQRDDSQAAPNNRLFLEFR